MAEETQQEVPVATHRGVLAGLGEEERAAKVQEAIERDLIAGAGGGRVEALAEQALEGPAVTTLAAQLEGFTRDKLV